MLTSEFVDAMNKNADYTDPAERAELADAYDELGCDREASELRADNAAELADRPRFVSYVTYLDPHSYEHRDIVDTCFTDHSHNPHWYTLCPTDRRWWYDVLSGLHDAEVQLAECSPELRNWLGDVWVDCDLEDLAEQIRRLISEYPG